MRQSASPDLIKAAIQSKKPEIHFTRRVTPGHNLGVFPASFNPVTTAHIQLIRRASLEFGLDEILALAGTSNADKAGYECTLEDRVNMLHLALDPVSNTSMGISSAPFFVDMVDPILGAYPETTRLSFILGFDTFVRLLDPDGKYVRRYRKKFEDQWQVLDYLLRNSELIVAERTYPDRPDLDELLKRHNIALNRFHLMDFPGDLSERSATEVREAVRAGRSIAGLVPAEVEDYIRSRGLYQA